jgi:hypothetical protein
MDKKIILESWLDSCMQDRYRSHTLFVLDSLNRSSDDILAI